MKRIIALMGCLGLLLTAVEAGAQPGPDTFERGKNAFREGRFEEAAAAFEQVTREDPSNAEAFFLLARVYYETPLKDTGKASDALDKALKLEPDNIQFLVAQLEQLRESSWNFFTEKIREVKRRQLADKILSLDPNNAFAHEELGSAYIRDFWRYRNAVMMPTLRLSQRSLSSIAVDEFDLSGATDADPNFDLNPNGQGGQAGGGGGTNITEEYFDPNTVFSADKFDLEALKAQGVPIQDLSRRAQRAYDQAVGHLHQALASDPRRRPVYDLIMRIVALKGAYEEALPNLQQMYSFFPEDAGTWMYLGLAHEQLGNMEAAAKSFETALQYMSADEKQAFNNLEMILPADEKKKYEDDPVKYASQYWTSKDPRFLTTFNERKLEHYARLVYADLLYGSKELNLRGWDTQRGQILVRYGLPNVDVVLLPSRTSKTAGQVLADSRANATPGDGLETSAGDPMARSRRILATKGTGFDMVEEANAYNIWDYGDFRFVFEDPFRNGEFRLYSPSAEEIARGVNPWLNDYAILAEETFKKTPEKYAYEAPGRRIEIPYLVTSFKGKNKLTEVYVNYGIPVVKYDPAQEMIDISANVGTFLISPNHDLLVERRRTIYGLRTDQIMPFAETNLWVDTQEMQAPPGEHEISVEFETASSATVAVQRREISVPDFSEEHLQLSDMLLAYHIEETPEGKPLGAADIVRRGLSIRPAPWSVFSHAQPIYLYFEAYNLQQAASGSTDYQVEIVLAPKDHAKGVSKLFKGLFGGKEGVSVRYNGTSTTPDDGQYQILDAVDLEPGLYTLRLHVKDNVGNKSADTEQDLFLE